MRLFLISLKLLLAISASAANRIDSLQTDKEVQDFLTELIPPQRDYQYSFSQLYANSCFLDDFEKKSSWKKLDFNQDGFTDLFARLYALSTETDSKIYYCYVIIRGPKGNYVVHEMPPYFYPSCSYAEPLWLNGIPHLLYQSYYLTYTTYEVPGKFELVDGSKKSVVKDTMIAIPRTDTLVYRFDGFIDFEPAQKNNLQAHSIKFFSRRGDPYGSDFTAFVDREGNGEYFLPKHYQKKVEILKVYFGQNTEKRFLDW